MAPVGHEMHQKCITALLGEERRVDAADVGGVVYERIDAKRRVAADVFGGKGVDGGEVVWCCCGDVLRC